MERTSFRIVDKKTEFKTRAEKCARDIIDMLIKNDMWIDTCVYVNGKRYSCYNSNGNEEQYHYDYSNTWDAVYVEYDISPKNYFDYVGDFLSMSFEGDFYEVLNYGMYPSVEKQFYKILDKYHKYYELGNAWNLTLYDN